MMVIPVRNNQASESQTAMKEQGKKQKNKKKKIIK